MFLDQQLELLPFEKLMGSFGATKYESQLEAKAKGLYDDEEMYEYLGRFSNISIFSCFMQIKASII